MYWYSRAFGVLAVALALILPTLAQDAAKKDPAKPDADKKAKADADKKADPAEKKTDKDKKATKEKKAKEEQPPEEKVVYGQVVSNIKLKQLDANSQKDFTIELLLPDPMKILQANQWQTQQMFSLSTQRMNALQRQQRIAQISMQMAQKNLLSPKDFGVRAAEDIKVRNLYPPTEYDEKGNIKRWTAKELKALKGHSKLPGYPAEFDALRPGQIVDVYLAKTSKALPTKNSSAKKLKVEEDPVEPDNRPKVVMIVIKQDVLPGQR